MTTDNSKQVSSSSQAGSSDGARNPLSPAAQRALAEAEERRAKAQQDTSAKARELQGPKGLEPTRYGDWEHKGIASDF